MTVYVRMHYKDRVVIPLDNLVYIGSNMSHLIKIVLCNFIIVTSDQEPVVATIYESKNNK